MRRFDDGSILEVRGRVGRGTALHTSLTALGSEERDISSRHSPSTHTRTHTHHIASHCIVKESVLPEGTRSLGKPGSGREAR